MLEDFAKKVSEEPVARANQAMANGCVVTLFLVPLAAAILMLATWYAENWLYGKPEPITINVYVTRPEDAAPTVKKLTEGVLPQLENYRLRKKGE